MRASRTPLCFALVALGCSTTTVVPAGDAGVDATDMEMPDAGEPAPSCRPGATLGVSCFRVEDCDDGCFCNGAERCEDGVCVAGPDACEDGADCTAHTCDEATDGCTSTSNDALCDDGNVCNGAERCTALGCTRGAPLVCTDDGDPCTLERCDPDAGCFVVTGDMCDPNPFPGCVRSVPEPPVCCQLAEICDNGLDDDCNGRADFFEEDCAPENETCASAALLPGPGRYVVATTFSDDDLVVACEAGASLGDVVFRIELAALSDVTATVAGSPDGSALALRGAGDADFCALDGVAASDFLPCSEREPGGALEVSAERLPAGTYYLIVATPTGAVMDLDLSITDAAPHGPCAGPALPAGGAVLRGTWSSTRDESAPPSCGGAPGAPDVCFPLSLPEASVVRASLRSTTASGEPVGSVLELSDAGRVACRADSVDAAFTSPELVAGPYALVGEPLDATADNWELSVDVAAADSCELCEAPCPIGPSELLAFDAATLSDDSGGDIGCVSTLSATDVYFLFRTTVPEERVEITIDAPGSNRWSVSDATSACLGTALTCVPGGFGGRPVATTLILPTAGEWRLAVQNERRFGTLEVQVRPTGSATP
ncbi:MAG: hypothetical protein AAGH15_01400 [Myxococcota bacterium]